MQDPVATDERIRRDIDFFDNNYTNMSYLEMQRLHNDICNWLRPFEEGCAQLSRDYHYYAPQARAVRDELQHLLRLKAQEAAFATALAAHGRLGAASPLHQLDELSLYTILQNLNVK
jgi:hypothetical protein